MIRLACLITRRARTQQDTLGDPVAAEMMAMMIFYHRAGVYDLPTLDLHVHALQQKEAFHVVDVLIHTVGDGVVAVVEVVAVFGGGDQPL